MTLAGARLNRPRVTTGGKIAFSSSPGPGPRPRGDGIVGTGIPAA